ncbi:Dockerin type 1 [Ruminiclostridium papyrosolvens DSM 2782]|uniref:cellulase n=1 Tax=Ruminiclostridium papyrosolvens DSM 2782 TaxID=588581 RepID=F1TIB1_9FIRM|nr:dockerin type I domain-containing protein [Ruminiclostridium papyrosolvens]EGD45889.1 Dockerin type 1 [Ruminiclostridium papyrosolvens DSM 2782]WES36369.1 dockerin type I domain-containing protein [Ruminiclostridium papyrosolvens DSM 2782]
MKKIVTLALTTAMALLAVLPLPASAEKTYKLGDVDNDTFVSALDLAAVRQHILGLKTLTGEAFKAADVNANGEIEALDLSELKQFLLGKITKFSGEGQQQPSGVGITWMDGKTLYPVGVNYAWYNWSYEFSDNNWNYNFSRIKSDLDTMSTKGIHALRWWVFPDLAYGPLWSGPNEGSLCTGLPEKWVDHMKETCDYAYSKGIKIYWTITSFDCARADDAYDHDDIIDNSTVLQSFLDNAMKPILQTLGTHPGVLGWDIINEPEWIIKKEDNGEPNNKGEIFPLSAMRNYIKTTCEFIHQYAKQPVSFGSANMKWLGAQYDLWDGLGLDFYDFHWYDWATPYFNPVTTPASSLKLDKPVIIGEMMPDTQGSSLKMTHKQVLDAIYKNGYAGYMLWSWNDGAFDCKPYVGNNFIDFAAEHPDVVK